MRATIQRFWGSVRTRGSAPLALAVVLLAGVALTLSGTPHQTLAQTATPVSTTAASPVAATATPSATADTGTSQPVTYSEYANGGGPSNIVNIVNQVDNRLRVRGSVQLNHIPGPNALPRNEADAYGSCTGCSTFSVALQVDLISANAGDISPQNYAVAFNYGCDSCVTVACALQYVVQVSDPVQVPDDVRSLVEDMQDELQAAQSDTDPSQVEAAINGVVGQFSSLTQDFYVQRQAAPQDTSSQTYPC